MAMPIKIPAGQSRRLPLISRQVDVRSQVPVYSVAGFGPPGKLLRCGNLNGIGCGIIDISFGLRGDNILPIGAFHHQGGFAPRPVMRAVTNRPDIEIIFR